MSDRYAVIGNPIGHSKSPQIHAAFARQTGQDISYDRLLAPLDAFEVTVRQFFHDGGRGLNVTVPFKRQAWDLVDRCEGSALAAEAVNTIKRNGKELVGYNTDGVGLLTDLEHNLGAILTGRRVLLMGAGGHHMAYCSHCWSADLICWWLPIARWTRPKALCGTFTGLHRWRRTA